MNAAETVARALRLIGQEHQGKRLSGSAYDSLARLVDTYCQDHRVKNKDLVYHLRKLYRYQGESNGANLVQRFQRKYRQRRDQKYRPETEERESDEENPIRMAIQTAG